MASPQYCKAEQQRDIQTTLAVIINSSKDNCHTSVFNRAVEINSNYILYD